MAARIAAARTYILSRFQQNVNRTVVQNSAQSSSAVHVAVPFPTIRSSSSSSTPAPTDTVQISEKRGHLTAVLGEQIVLYRDVPINAWFAPYVAFLIEDKIAEGYKDVEGKPTGMFGVDNPITKAEVLKLALEAAGKDVSSPLPPPRNESARGTWASPYVRLAEDLQLTVFDPDIDVHKPATRGEVIQTLLEAMLITIGRTAPTYVDVPADHPHAHAIAAATFFGIIEGDRDADGRLFNTFRPDDPMNRAEVAKIIALAREVMK